MLRSMFTSIGALTLHQSFMDVVANNLANVNTPGYKGSRITFQDQVSQLLSAGAGPSATLGGINPIQIGLGVRMGSVVGNFSQGALQATSRVTDVALQGEGFFIYTNNQTQFYSRDGALDMDSEGYLVNAATGMRLQGWQAITIGGSAGQIDTGLPIGDMQIPINSTLARATSQTIVRGNLDSTATAGSAGAVYPATIGVYDSQGELHSIRVTFTKTADNTWDWAVSDTDPAINVAGNGTINFSPTGQFISATPNPTNVTLTPVAGQSSAAVSQFTLDLTKITQLATNSDVSLSFQNGVAAGALSGFNIVDNTGEIFGLYSNGLQERIGQMAVATFSNPGGLERVGQNLFVDGLNSGTASIGLASVQGRGTVISGYLEASNVDMAQEFTNMILAQRGFQASSRVITTSDEMLQELVNLKR